ncbi:MAG: manganese efflux pump MntP family protein [Spirulina sp.]
METILASIIISLSTNLDNLAVGMACGVNQFHIRLRANFLIAVLSGMSTLSSMLVGDWLNHLISSHWAQLLGSGILIAIGLLSIVEALQIEGKLPGFDELVVLPAMQLNARMMSLREAGILGLVLTLSNWGTGIGAGIAHLDLGLTSSCSFLSSLLTIGGGVLLGKVATQYFRSDCLAWIAGLLLIGLGIYEII